MFKRFGGVRGRTVIKRITRPIVRGGVVPRCGYHTVFFSGDVRDDV